MPIKKYDFQNELFRCCKKGNIETLKNLIENHDVELNVRDKWDSTPLYYACLCGHVNLVRYLLNNGARCESNTFDGERCVYGALTSEIRAILVNNFNVITSKIKRRDNFDEFLRKCYESGDYFDVIFSVHKQIFKVHRCILSARCDYFNDMFNDKWKNRKFIYINNYRVTPSAFEVLIKYFYTDRLEALIDEVEDVKALLKQCKLFDLLDQVDAAIKKINSFKKLNKPGTNITTILVETNKRWSDFGVLVQQSLPSKYRSWVDGSELPFLPNLAVSPFSDVFFKVEDEIFKCHKVFFCGRSEFFEAFIQDHFLEAHEQINDVQVFTLQDISIEAFIGLISFIYQNQVELTDDIVWELLFASDIFLLPGLKKLSAEFIGRNLTTDKVIANLKFARLMQLSKLEFQCTEYIALRLDEFISNEEFHSLIKEDAENVKHREETDTIDIIDDIRYHISNVQGFSSLKEANDKIVMIDQLLELLQLDA